MATTDGQNPKRIGLAVLVIAGVALLQHGASSGYVRGPGAVGSKKADHRQNSPSPAGIPLRVLTLGLSTRAEACDAPVPSGAELLLAEECGRVHADVTLGLRLFAEADGAGRVVIKNCGGAHGGADEGACDHLTLWGRVVANTAIAGARSTIAGVDVVPAAGRRCEWGVTLPLITDKTAVRPNIHGYFLGTTPSPAAPVGVCAIRHRSIHAPARRRPTTHARSRPTTMAFCEKMGGGVLSQS